LNRIAGGAAFPSHFPSHSERSNQCAASSRRASCVPPCAARASSRSPLPPRNLGRRQSAVCSVLCASWCRVPALAPAPALALAPALAIFLVPVGLQGRRPLSSPLGLARRVPLLCRNALVCYVAGVCRVFLRGGLSRATYRIRRVQTSRCNLSIMPGVDTRNKEGLMPGVKLKLGV
jgi:hypothetical protein